MQARVCLPQSAPAPGLARRRAPGSRSRALIAHAEPEENQPDGPSGMESLFMQELKRRGIEKGQGSKPGLEVADKRPPQARNPFDVQSDELGGQLARSRALQSEGLEGLIPRASQLVALGGSFFLAFGPFIVAVLAVTGGVYLYWGDTFIHGGRPGAGMPSYIDPQDLLDEPTYDPMVPLRAPPPPVAAPAPGPVPIGENPNAAFY